MTFAILTIDGEEVIGSHGFVNVDGRHTIWNQQIVCEKAAKKIKFVKTNYHRINGANIYRGESILRSEIIKTVKFTI